MTLENNSDHNVFNEYLKELQALFAINSNLEEENKKLRYENEILCAKLAVRRELLYEPSRVGVRDNIRLAAERAAMAKRDGANINTEEL